MNWTDYTEIAQKLNELYPNSPVDALALSKEDLIKMIVSLPDFKGDKNDSEAEYHAKFIRNEWVSVRMPKTYYDSFSALDYHSNN